jgi:Secretion system C-terminal sorting domain
MKKFILLFATMLAMSGLAFGQKEGKVLWQRELGQSLSNVTFNNLILISPQGKSLIRTSDVSMYDANGNFTWKLSDYYKNSSFISVQTIFNGLLSVGFTNASTQRQDSVMYFNKEFEPIKKYNNGVAYQFTSQCREGFFRTENNLLVKYDQNGKEEWRYNSPTNPIQIFSNRAPYVGQFLSPSSPNDYAFIIFDKNGKKLNNLDSGNKPLFQLLHTRDNGFWFTNGNFERLKYDSTGTQTAKYSGHIGQFSTLSESSSILADNSLVLNYLKDDEVSLIKISPNGDIKTLGIPVRIKIKNGSLFVSKVVPNQNKIMYSIRLPETEQAEADIKYKIGVVDFDNSANSWSKDILGGASNGIDGNAFTFEAGNTFFQVYSSPINPPIKFFKVYDIKGNLIWESPFYISSAITQSKQWKIIDEYVYTALKIYLSADGTLLRMESGNKIKFNDGKDVWNRKDLFFSNGDIQKDIQIDKNGNDVILYPKYVGIAGQGGFQTYRIETLNPDGTEKWGYNPRNNDNFKSYKDIFFNLTNDGKLIVLSQETKDNKQQYILRKISPCEDLLSTATASATEVCPTEKVKLSIPKQDGVTYQWQKDGKDLAGLVDAVYDFGETGTYSVIIKDEACQNQVVSNAIKINIRSLPTAEIKAPKITFCEGDKTVITAQTNGTFFQWQKDEKDIPNATVGIFEASAAGFYRVGVRDDKCPQVGFSNIIPIIIKPLPEAIITTDIKTVISEPFTVKMTANSGTNLSYQWLKNDTLIANATTNIYETKKSGKYKVSVSKDGCTKTSEALNISIQIALANEGEIGEEVVKIYPNPSRGEFKIMLPKTLQNADIQIFDILGCERTLLHTGEQAQANGLVQGTYFLRVSKGDKSITNKIVIE